MRLFQTTTLIVLFSLLAIPFGFTEDSPTIQLDYVSKTDQTFTPKGEHFRLLEDHDLKVHNRPYLVLGHLKVIAAKDDNVTWKQIENRTAEFCINKGADSLINMKSSSAEDSNEEDEYMWLECDLIVYLDKDQYGHFGFWYNNSIRGIAGVRIEHVVIGSPAQDAGLKAGDILKAISGESTGMVNIRHKNDYKNTQYKLKVGEEYTLFIERHRRPLVVTIIPASEDEVYDWDKKYGGL